FFFFSSRRRHTRSYGDWSSDVCSSDLVGGGSAHAQGGPGFPHLLDSSRRQPCRCASGPVERQSYTRSLVHSRGAARGYVREPAKIGRASCRERVERSVVGGYLKKK